MLPLDTALADRAGGHLGAPLDVAVGDVVAHDRPRDVLVLSGYGSLGGLVVLRKLPRGERGLGPFTGDGTARRSAARWCPRAPGAGALGGAAAAPAGRELLVVASPSVRRRGAWGPGGKVAAGQGAGVGVGAGDVVIDRWPRITGRAGLRTGQAAVLLGGRVRGGGREAVVVAVRVGVREGEAALRWPAVDMEASLAVGGGLVVVLKGATTTVSPLVLGETRTVGVPFDVGRAPDLGLVPSAEGGRVHDECLRTMTFNNVARNPLLRQLGVGRRVTDNTEEDGLAGAVHGPLGLVGGVHMLLDLGLVELLVLKGRSSCRPLALEVHGDEVLPA